MKTKHARGLHYEGIQEQPTSFHSYECHCHRLNPLESQCGSDLYRDRFQSSFEDTIESTKNIRSTEELPDKSATAAEETQDSEEVGSGNGTYRELDLAQGKAFQKSMWSLCKRRKMSVLSSGCFDSKEPLPKAELFTEPSQLELSPCTTPVASVRVFGSWRPQINQNVMVDLSVDIATSRASVYSEHVQLSRPNFDSLSIDLLVKIICVLQHDQVKPVFFVCRRLREAVLIASQLHFNFHTPVGKKSFASRLLGASMGQERFLKMRGHRGASTNSVGQPLPPNAPKGPTKMSLKARLSQDDVKQLATVLLQESGSYQIQRRLEQLCRPVLKGISNRVLFSKEKARKIRL